MSTVADALEDAAEAAQGRLNSEERSLKHVALGMVLITGFAIVASGLATRVTGPRHKPSTLMKAGRLEAERPGGSLGLVLPAMFSATTFSALSVWNAPSRPESSHSLVPWVGAQSVNAIWLGLRPASLGGLLAAAMSSAGLAAVFSCEARKLVERTAKGTATNSRGQSLANGLDRRLKPWDQGFYPPQDLHARLGSEALVPCRSTCAHCPFGRLDLGIAPNFA